jgi:hypothetical protein
MALMLVVVVVVVVLVVVVMMLMTTTMKPTTTMMPVTMNASADDIVMTISPVAYDDDDDDDDDDDGIIWIMNVVCLQFDPCYLQTGDMQLFTPTVLWIFKPEDLSTLNVGRITIDGVVGEISSQHAI